MDKKYTISSYASETMNLRALNWKVDRNEVTLSWEWPIDREIRLVLIFKCSESDPSIENLMQSNHPHEIVVRDLASTFTAIIPEERCKFLVCPANFNENRTIAICPNAITTDWVYKKAIVTTNVNYKTITLGQYQKTTLEISMNDTDQIQLLTKVLTYSVCEHDHIIASYPVDIGLITNGGHLYIKKNQTIKFTLQQDYMHLFDLR